MSKLLFVLIGDNRARGFRFRASCVRQCQISSLLRGLDPRIQASVRPALDGRVEPGHEGKFYLFQFSNSRHLSRGAHAPEASSVAPRRVREWSAGRRNILLVGALCEGRRAFRRSITAS